MSHLRNKTRGGYWPFPSGQLPAIASLFQPMTAPGGLLLDPCAGEGEALEALAQALNLKPHANELDHDRARACRERFGILQAIQGDLFDLRTPLESYSLVWVNPPYTENAGGAEENRRELEMLRESWRWAQEGGYVAWIVYAHHMSERAARFLCERSQVVDVWRLPGKHLDHYVQIAVIAQTRRRPAEAETTLEARIAALVEDCHNPDHLLVLEPQTEPLYHFPAPPAPRRWYFRQEVIPPEAVQESLEYFGAHSLVHQGVSRARDGVK